MINLKKGQDSPSLSSEFKKEFNNSSDLTLSFIDATLREMLDPARYVGSCVQMVDDVVKKWRK